MEIKFTVKTMDEIIGYWIELAHIVRVIENITEYTDCMAEKYDFGDWLIGSDSEKDTLSNLTGHLMVSGESASNMYFGAEEKLLMVIGAAIDAGDERFAKYQGTAYEENKINIIESVHERFDDVYSDFDDEEQVENFYNVLFKCMDDILLSK